MYTACSVLALGDVRASFAAVTSAQENDPNILMTPAMTDDVCFYFEGDPGGLPALALELKCDANNPIDPTALTNSWQAEGMVTPVSGLGDFAMWVQDYPDAASNGGFPTNGLVVVKGNVVATFGLLQSAFPSDGEAKMQALMQVALSRL
jgi:hypothetical protein